MRIGWATRMRASFGAPFLWLVTLVYFTQIFRMDSSFVPDERHTEAITIGITVCGLCCTLSVEHQTNLRVDAIPDNIWAAMPPGN
ncbi:Vacuole effluxer Atg22 like [Musa troglodytarum]|uniref:Vacuole effluxer Atg22 like n=1 Tax=Musa troglodytarum TaxID=320322 RepID=A0A9E7HK92_9LILI|nr:Vacuole effluxer Atg22 like [Musa troglodytarum]